MRRDLSWARMALVSVALMVAPSAFAQSGVEGLSPQLASAGVTSAQWQAIERQVRAAAARAQISERALLAAARATGDQLIASGRLDPLALQSAIIQALDAQAEELGHLQARLERLEGDLDPTTAQTFADARRAIEDGRLADADRLLARVADRDLSALQAAEAEVERRRLRAGETIASRGQLSFIQADYMAAAGHFARAADVLPQTAIAQRWQVVMLQAGAVFRQGAVFEDNERLRQAVSIYENEALPLAPRASRPLDWSRTFNDMTAPLIVLGERGDDSAWQRGLTAIENALAELTEARDAAAWASAQHNLGVTLTVIGEGAGDEQALIRAAGAFEASMRASSATGDAVALAATQASLGNALYLIGELRRNAALLTQAALLFEAALTVQTRDRDPVKWAWTMTGLANTRGALGRFGNESVLRQAIRDFDDVLQVRTRQRDPSGWAQVQTNQGSALTSLGMLGDDDALARAVTAYEASLTVRTRAINPDSWARTQNNLGRTRLLQGDRARARGQAAQSLYTEALAHFRLAAEIFTPERSPVYARTIAANIAETERKLASEGD